MLKNLEKYNRVFQLGTQIHAGDNYHRVTEIIQSGNSERYIPYGYGKQEVHPAWIPRQPETT
jgi:hypothetical protein